MTTPTGKLAWGQANSYDAIDDRQVIAAVTRNRTGPHLAGQCQAEHRPPVDRGGRLAGRGLVR